MLTLSIDHFGAINGRNSKAARSWNGFLARLARAAAAQNLDQNSLSERAGVSLNALSIWNPARVAVNSLIKFCALSSEPTGWIRWHPPFPSARCRWLKRGSANPDALVAGSRRMYKAVTIVRGTRVEPSRGAVHWILRLGYYASNMPRIQSRRIELAPLTMPLQGGAHSSF